MPAREVALYAETAQTLEARNVRVLVLDTSDVTPSEAAAGIAEEIPVSSVPPTTSPNTTHNPTGNMNPQIAQPVIDTHVILRDGRHHS